jgi:hypothetical protein
MATEEQREWTRKMDALIQEGLTLLGQDPNSQLGDWLTVISAPYLNEEGHLTSGYSIAFSGNLLEHNALGLLAKGEGLLMRDEDDDE